MNNSEHISKSSNVVHGEFSRGVLARAIDQIKAWNERRVAIRQLNSLSDRMLDDIGIERFQIPVAVKQPGLFVRIGAEQASRPQDSAVIKQAA